MLQFGIPMIEPPKRKVHIVGMWSWFIHVPLIYSDITCPPSIDLIRPQTTSYGRGTTLISFVTTLISCSNQSRHYMHNLIAMHGKNHLKEIIIVNFPLPDSI